jgi:hypothetical protein
MEVLPMLNESDRNFIAGVVAVGTSAMLIPLGFIAFIGFQLNGNMPVQHIDKVVIHDNDTTNTTEEYVTENKLEHKIRYGLLSFKCNENDRSKNESGNETEDNRSQEDLQ